MSDPVIRRHSDGRSGEFYLSFRHKTGVRVLIAPNEYSSYTAIYTSAYGGADTSFVYNGKEYKTPTGTAHFLEHKIFETEDGGDAFRLFAGIGADSNAFTTHTQTSFTFTTANEFYEALKILISFVHSPHFTDGSVEKERKIISEELKMYEDAPDSRCFYELLRCMYKYNPVRYDVGGTQRSIRQINADTLYQCHKIFYDPSNMSLVISGNVEAKKVIELLDECVPASSGEKVQKIRPDEPPDVVFRSSRIKTDVSEPLFAFGIKDPYVESRTKMRKKGVALSVLSNTLFGESSELYCSLYEKGLISGEIDVGYTYSDSYAYISVMGESKKPATVKRRIEETIEKAINEGVNKEDFELTKKVFYSGFAYSLQNSQSIAYSLLDFYQSGEDMLAYPALLSGITADQACRYLKQIYRKTGKSFVVTAPADNKEE